MTTGKNSEESSAAGEQQGRKRPETEGWRKSNKEELKQRAGEANNAGEKERGQRDGEQEMAAHSSTDHLSGRVALASGP